MGPAPRLIRPRVVLDTNVVVSTLLFGGRAMGWIADAWQSGRATPLASAQTTTELVRVLGYPKFRLSQAERDELLGEYLPWCEAAEVDRLVDVPDCRDPDDRIFLELAVSASADALVTGDGDLLVLAPVLDMPVLTPTAFKDALDIATSPPGH